MLSMVVNVLQSREYGYSENLPTGNRTVTPENAFRLVKGLKFRHAETTAMRKNLNVRASLSHCYRPRPHEEPLASGSHS